jgi:PIN domain nuclease of toxin-antitoxin system
VRLLLDTNVVLWMLDDPARLSRTAREALEDPANTLLVSAVSILEAAIKVSTGKLVIDYDLPEVLAELGCELLDVTRHHAWRLRTLPRIHGDPFDRLLIAQAIEEKLVLMTSDRLLADYQVPVMRA